MSNTPETKSCCGGKSCPDCGPCHAEGLEQEVADAQAEKEAINAAKPDKTHLNKDEQLALFNHTDASCGEAIKSLIRGVPVLTGAREFITDEGQPKHDNLSIDELNEAVRKVCPTEEDILTHIIGFILAKSSGGHVAGRFGKLPDGRHVLTFILGEAQSDPTQGELPLEKVDTEKP